MIVKPPNIGSTIPDSVPYKNDLLLVEHLKSKNDKWSNMILNVWCNRDVNKLNQARANHLNYIPVYSDDFDNFILSLKENRIWDLVK